MVYLESGSFNRLNSGTSWTMSRRDSMFSAFSMVPADSAHRLCDIDRVLLRITKSSFQKIGKSLHDENSLITPNF